MIEGFLWCVASGFLFGVISCLTNQAQNRPPPRWRPPRRTAARGKKRPPEWWIE
jgi:hypothetical protein